MLRISLVTGSPVATFSMPFRAKASFDPNSLEQTPPSSILIGTGNLRYLPGRAQHPDQVIPGSEQLGKLFLEGIEGICYAPIPMNLHTIYSKKPDFIQRDVAGECILVPIRRTLTEANSIYVLNETGAALWSRIDGTRPIHEIASVFAEEYDVATEQLNQDLETLLADLLSIHAIEEVAVADGPSR
jgi:hypothetical protein